MFFFFPSGVFVCVYGKECVNLCISVGFVCAMCHNYLMGVCAHVRTFTVVCSGRGEVNCGLPSVNGMSQTRYLD